MKTENLIRREKTMNFFQQLIDFIKSMIETIKKLVGDIRKENDKKN